MKRPHDDAGGDGLADDGHGASLFIEEDTERVPPYDAKKEDLPPCKLYTADCKRLEEGKDKISHLLDAPFQESSFRSGPTDGLQEDHRRRIKDPSSDKIKVGVVGDMSSGKCKSSVINSLLSMGVIARQGDAGSSCTWVVNEFSSLLPNQARPFAAEVYFFTQQQRYDIIKALVADYYRASPKDHDSSDGPKDTDQATDDVTTMQGVVTSFRALFSHRPEFCTVQKANEYLAQAECEDDEAIIEYLCDQSDRLMAEVLRGNCVRYEADTPQSLLLAIESYQHTVEEQEDELVTSPWPFASHIKFGMDCNLLEHVTLVDLPGLSDANKTRVANATAHLRTCTHYLIVAHIGRAKDDKFIRQHLSRGFATRGSGRVMLVLTHADSLDESAEIMMTRRGQESLDEVTAQKEDLEKRKLELLHKIKKLPKGMEKYGAMEARDAVTKQLQELSGRFQEVRIHMRSLNVSKQMMSLYKELTDDPLDLSVCCVGNAAYKKHQAGYSTDDPNPPMLSVSGTQIPMLRQHLYRAPTDGRLNEMRNQIMIQIPAILGSCELYVAKIHMARKDEIGRIVLEPQQLIHSVVDCVFEQLKADADKNILGQFRQDEFAWTTEAQKLCDGWAEKQSTAGHLALLKKDGVRKGTKRTKGANWNSELVRINAAEIRQWFGDLGPSLEAAQKAIVKEVNSMATKMSNTIRSDPQIALMALQPFLNYVYAEKATIQQRAEEPMRRLRREIGNIQRAVTTDEVNDPVIRAMGPVYEEARKIKNRAGVKGSTPKMRLSFFNGAVTRHGDGVWMAAHDLLESDINSTIDAYADELKNAMMEFFAAIEKKFNVMCAEKGTEDEREVELRQQLSKKTLEAREFYEKELRPLATRFFNSKN